MEVKEDGRERIVQGKLKKLEQEKGMERYRANEEAIEDRERRRKRVRKRRKGG